MSPSYPARSAVRRLTVCAALMVAATTSPASVRAQATTLNFNTLTESVAGSGTRFVNNCYQENGFMLTAVGVLCTGPTSQNVFLAAGPNSPLFGGGATPSLILNSPTASLIDLTRVDGGRFLLSSIGLAPFDGAATTLTFTGLGNSNPIVSTFMLNGLQSGFQTFTFGAAFANLTSVRITAMNEFGEPLVKFDNIGVTAQTTVPEPSTVLLMAVGLLAVTTLSRRRHRLR